MSHDEAAEGKALGDRRLTAIMFTDVVGSSRLMGRDEERAVRLITRDLDFISTVVAQHSGQELKRMGDGLLAVFDSAVHAIDCAQAIQSQFSINAATQPAEEVLQHRIGLHLGDVYIRNGDVMGDGVNIAARLQSEAPPGGICMSQAIYELVKARLSLKTVYQGMRRLKNIPAEMHIYQLAVDNSDVDEEGPPSAQSRKHWLWIVGGTLALLAGVLALGMWVQQYIASQRAEKPSVESTPPPVASTDAGATAGQTAAADQTPKAVEKSTPTQPSEPAELPQTIRLFERLDKNHDGRIRAAEIPETQRSEILHFDSNGDHILTISEFDQSLRKELEWPQAVIERFDADKDGVISRKELPKEKRERLMEADRDNDNQLTRKELEAFQRNKYPQIFKKE